MTKPAASLSHSKGLGIFLFFPWKQQSLWNFHRKTSYYLKNQVIPTLKTCRHNKWYIILVTPWGTNTKQPDTPAIAGSLVTLVVLRRRLRSLFKQELKELYHSQNASSDWIHLAWNLAYFEILQHKSVHKNVSDTAMRHNNRAVQKYTHAFEFFPDIIF